MCRSWIIYEYIKLGVCVGVWGCVCLHMHVCTRVFPVTLLLKRCEQAYAHQDRKPTTNQRKDTATEVQWDEPMNVLRLLTGMCVKGHLHGQPKCSCIVECPTQPGCWLMKVETLELSTCIESASSCLRPHEIRNKVRVSTIPTLFQYCAQSTI